jgi:uncharacterized protein
VEKSRLVLILVLCCVLTLSLAGCSDDLNSVMSRDSTSTTDALISPTSEDNVTTTESTTTTIPRPVFTEDDPLRVFLAGDSLMIEVGHSFDRTAEGLKSLELYRINKVSSGFSTPEAYDWHKQLSETVAEFDPRVTVMMFGSNDKVPMTIDGVQVQPFTDEWKAEYVKRVKEGIKIVTDSGSIVIWISMPIMESGKFSETARTFNAMYEQICLDDPNAYYIDAYTLFSDENGDYTAYLPDSNGDLQQVREDDGIHFTPAGGDRVVEAVLERLNAAYDLQ